jgi:hypothetical protein
LIQGGSFFFFFFFLCLVLLLKTDLASPSPLRCRLLLCFMDKTCRECQRKNLCLHPLSLFRFVKCWAVLCDTSNSRSL